MINTLSCCWRSLLESALFKHRSEAMYKMQIPVNTNQLNQLTSTTYPCWSTTSKKVDKGVGKRYPTLLNTTPLWSKNSLQVGNYGTRLTRWTRTGIGMPKPTRSEETLGSWNLIHAQIPLDHGRNMNVLNLLMNEKAYVIDKPFEFNLAIRLFEWSNRGEGEWSLRKGTLLLASLKF